ncbi:hypothetical protein Mp_5g12300 [Marchantia polymorpha subsp. ruderalis]|uniref:Uncharacterized protein n=2 Tax=Marchantia polymorpha TaxID=3197 RepID=A0AAF6BHK1_MARPO|nr:hypothetical protein MARPO_0092s0076 [Marchantia polymorpha]BBN11485.1 hypothetical protein Mp_5g12300 [Marchantia polymorpha subsp. ruderalis]|eukprot:PTQ33115.1 hypothetical protein MARPO_0092s0076 [Marchantia polymorpha]
MSSRARTLAGLACPRSLQHHPDRDRDAGRDRSRALAGSVSRALDPSHGALASACSHDSQDSVSPSAGWRASEWLRSHENGIMQMASPSLMLGSPLAECCQAHASSASAMIDGRHHGPAPNLIHRARYCKCSPFPDPARGRLGLRSCASFKPSCDHDGAGHGHVLDAAQELLSPACPPLRASRAVFRTRILSSPFSPPRSRITRPAIPRAGNAPTAAPARANSNLCCDEV